MLLTCTCTCCRDEIEALIAESMKRVDAPPEAANGGPGAVTKDDLAALLTALAAVYEVAPQLWLEPELRYGCSATVVSQLSPKQRQRCGWSRSLSEMSIKQGQTQCLTPRRRIAMAVLAVAYKVAP